MRRLNVPLQVRPGPCYNLSCDPMRQMRCGRARRGTLHQEPVGVRRRRCVGTSPEPAMDVLSSIQTGRAAPSGGGPAATVREETEGMDERLTEGELRRRRR